MLPPDAIDFYGFFMRLFGFVQAAPGEAHNVWTAIASVGNIIAVIGLSISFLMLVLTVYLSIRLEQMEHMGFHNLEMAEHIVHEAHEAPPKNPRWQGVQALAASPNESDWRRAIMEADIMLSELLRERGYPGDTLGEQLKNANPLQFTTLDIAWEAHRMRNALAHLGEAFPLSERDARATVDQYRRVFEEFDYI